MFRFYNGPGSKVSSPDREICKCRRQERRAPVLFTFKWSAKTNAEGRLSKHLKYLGVGKALRARGRKLWE